MEFLKKHYEKILLSVVLLGLAVAAGWLAFQIKSTQEEVQRMLAILIEGTPKPFEVMKGDAYTAMIAKATNVIPVDLNVSNKVFNPVQWKRKADNTLIRGDDLGAAALRLTNDYPLYLIVEPMVQGGTEKPEYRISFERQYEKVVGSRKAGSRPVTVQEPGKAREESMGTRIKYKVLSASGTNTATAKMEVELSIDGEKLEQPVTITKSEPFKKIMGYGADLEYPPDPSINLKLKDRREGDDLVFGGDTNNIVAIKSDMVVLSAASTGMRTQIKYKPATP